MTTSTQTPAGWYADPAGAAQYRWFDGNVWTSHVQPSQQQASGGCQQCGAVPAIPVKLHGHIGMLILQRFLTYRGRYCRDCGISQFRNVQKQLLLLGWWGFISFFVTIVNIGQNLFTFSRLRSLSAPQNRLANPAAPGGSVFASPGFAVSVIIALVVLVALLH